MKELTATIFDIQRFSVHDGPGIRTTVFFKGCPLSCKWCHNPEGLSPHIQLQYFAQKCILCGKCSAACENNCHIFEKNGHTVDFDRCRICGKCIDCCPSAALKLCGREITVPDLMRGIQKDRDFYGSEGGITFSGGECLRQSEFVSSALQALKREGLHTAVDTSGCVKWEAIQSTLPFCDLYLYDIKAFTPLLHQKATGANNTLILENLRRLDGEQKDIWIRIPIIPGYNASAEEMTKIADFLKSLRNIKKITVMPYHTLGKSKYETLGLECTYHCSRMISDGELAEYKKILQNEEP